MQLKTTPYKNAGFFVYAPKAADTLIVNECEYVLNDAGTDSTFTCGTERLAPQIL
jgi:hypothetical protein